MKLWNTTDDIYSMISKIIKLDNDDVIHVLHKGQIRKMKTVSVNSNRT